jgi:hypothetical protein
MKQSPIIECHKGMLLWKRLGWLPYCPKAVRKHLPFIKSMWLPYNAIKWKSTGKLKFFYE